MGAVAGAREASEAAGVDLLELPFDKRHPLGGAAAVRLRQLGLADLRALLFHLPRRYDDFSRPMTLAALRARPPEGPVSATVELVELRVEPGFRRRVQRTVARLRDETGEGEAVWFGRRYIERRLAAGQRVALSGKVELRGWLPRFQNPEFGPAGDDALHAGRIVPVYRLTARMTAAWLRATMRTALERYLGFYEEYLPAEALAAFEHDPPNIREAIEWVHFPPDFGSLDRALGRLAFDELLALQLGMLARQRQRTRESAQPVVVADDRYEQAVAAVEAVIGGQIQRRRAAGATAEATPAEARVELTDDQRAALAAVRADLAGERPMLRLLQGDVGSGKTAVAALALAFVANAGGQGALLAPTDLLARQHAQTLAALLEPLGHGVTLLTGSLPAAARREALELLVAPVPVSVTGASLGRVVVGTHALFQERVSFADLRLVVVDEQHRFGVTEREALAAKGTAPHVLLMTATPIPRTLSQIVHADLDVSDLRTPPAGRRKIGTAIRRPHELVTREDGKQGALALIVQEVAAGRRAFVVVPLVEDDADSAAQSVEQAATLLRSKWPEAVAVAGVGPTEPRLEIVHGQLKASERDGRMERFRRGEVDIVVGTTVLEVGVDVPEASVMLIFDADRFGLAQLHQLRGRVGRGEAESWCVLVSERYPSAEPQGDEEAVVKARLDAVARTQDGFELAELDLEQRREGELLGVHQSGLPPLRVVSLGRPAHRELSLRARAVAERLLGDDGRLPDRHARLAAELAGGWLRRVGAGEVLAAGEAERA
ncbi:MAG TPA: ATP-dependent DNA helicase RecG [Candidatus Limnocylindria bacterium]|nr:ATP-dependent DNA helicase RecG [Candidatus Limnocylindria bacterium]